MPLPSPNKNEDRKSFMSRCMGDDAMNKEYPESKQRTAVCISRACEGMDTIAEVDFKFYFEEFGYEEELTEDNFYVPTEAEYEDFGEETEEWDVSIAKPGLWENIRKKKEREGKDYKPAKKGDPDRPDPEAWKKAQSAEYQGRKVQLGKPFRTPKGPKKMSVYVKNDKGNVVKVNFGDPNMKIKKSDPARRKSFRARHNCDNPGPRWKARYWSCRAW
jgi:hypothetical protein